MTRRAPFPSVLRNLVLLLVLACASTAAAQECSYEIEPNDTPAEATRISGVGPDGPANAVNARLGTACLAGELGGNDQDAFWWEVDELGAAHQWRVEFEGISGQLNRLTLYRIEFADDGVGVTSAAELFDFASPNGSTVISEPFLVEPGRYMIGVSTSGGEGQYVANLRPQGLGYRSTQLRSGSAFSGEFRAYGAVGDGFEQPFTIPEEDAGFAWGLELESAIGHVPRLVLEGAGGEIGDVQGEGSRARLSGYALEPGEYVARIVGNAGTARLTLTRQGRLGDGMEIEPNDRWEDATLFPLGGEMTGTATNADFFRIEVSAAEAAQAWDLVVEAGAEIEVTLANADGVTLQQRRGVGGTLAGLHLAEGAYRLSVNRRSEDTDYRLALRPAAAASGAAEREPNDALVGATDLGGQPEARGSLVPQDSDFYRFEVSGPAQLYRLQTVGEGVTEMIVYSAGGVEQARTRGERRLRLDDLVLLPGAQYVEVKGTGGEYAFRALALGPAPDPEPPADMPAADEELAAAAAGPEREPADAPVAAEPEVEEVVSAPPPPGLLEREPNDDLSRAHRLVPGAVHVGRFTDADDADTYRFYLAGDQYVRLELVSPDGDVSIPIDLEGAGRYHALPGEEGEPVVVERWLLAGDHSLQVRGRSVPGEAPNGYYQLRLTLLGALGLPVDLEPNDEPATAARMPSELSWQGMVGEAGDYDLYAFPTFPTETGVTVTLEGDADVSPQVRSETGTERVRPDEAGAYRFTLPAAQAAYLELRGKGRFRVSVEFDAEPDRAQLLPPRAGDALRVTLDAPVDELAAFWHEGQTVEAMVTVENLTPDAQAVQLTAAASDVLTTVELPEGIELGPGESRQLPLSLTVPADARDDLPLGVQVAARSAVGSAVAGTDFALRCEAPPVGPSAYLPLPRSLLGRSNVLWSGYGAGIHGESAYINRDRALIDGRTTISYGGYLSAEHSPTFQLAGDEPVTLIGTALHPQAGSATLDQLRRFRIETSMDGVTFTPAFEGRLQAARVEQAFLFDQPVTARYARLVVIDSYRGRADAYAGEWKLFGEDAALFSGVDLAAPVLGGHVVWSEPLMGSRDTGILTADSDTGDVDLRDYDALTFVLGFQDGRAAKLDRLVWREAADTLERPEQMFDSLTVEASLTGAAGPWEAVAEWELERDAGGVATHEFEPPVWARYLRFTAPKREGGRSYSPPDQLSVHEAEVGTDGYLSVLAEWGDASRAGPYEFLVGGDEVFTAEPETDNDTRERATPLAAGQVTSGTVAVSEDIDWYRITVGPDDNHLELRLSGDPAIAYTYELVDADGNQVAYETRDDGDSVVLTLYADPGDYFLRLEEPKRTVVFSWDTSGSVSPYQDITYNSLANFARDVDGEREAVQLLAYDDPTPRWLLPYWSFEPLRVQRAIQEFDRNADSSNTEIALLTATRALADREGTRAILLMTDAESGGHSLSPALWRAMEEVRPRVFTFEISSGGSDYAQEMMQDYAAVNAGYYDMADGVGDFDAGFSRASCILRRPKRYEVEVTVAAVAPPGPGSLSVAPAPGAAPAAVEIVFDASGSMGRELPSGEQRITAAKRALETLVGEVLPEGTPFALRAFGHVTPSSCETRLDVPFAPIDRQKAMTAVGAIEPKLLSGTPIAESLALVADDLSAAGGARTVILITDGAESCGGDPAAAVRQLRESGPVALAIVSLALEPDALAVFEALAADVGASYVDVGSYEALSDAIAEALNPAYEVYDKEGALVAQGRVGGEALELPMGVYRVRVMSAPVEVFENVRVPGDGKVALTLGGR